jgi:hypothetical protein
LLALIFLSIFHAAPSEARVYDFYRYDRRFKGGFCAAIGGACAADNDIVTGIFENPAALATGEADWDFDGDLSTKQNLEGNPKDVTNHGESAGVIGVSYTTGKLGTGLAFAMDQDDVDSQMTLFDDAGLPKKVSVSDTARRIQFRVPLGWQVSDALSFGVGLSLTRHSQDLSINGSNVQPDSVASSFVPGISFGVLYKDSDRLRLGSWFRLPTTMYETLRISSASLATRVDYLEDLALHYPWIWALGGQLALGESDLGFAELDVIGRTRNAYLYSYNTLSSSVNDTNLTPKGRNLAVEPHLGYRHRLGSDVRLHTGAYYAPSRIDGVPGYLHGTAGVSVNAFKIAEVIGGVDYAKNTLQIIFTFR